MNDSLRKVHQFFKWMVLDNILFLLGCLFLCCHYITVLVVILLVGVYELRKYPFQDIRSPAMKDFFKGWYNGSRPIVPRVKVFLERFGVPQIDLEKIQYPKRGAFRFAIRFGVCAASIAELIAFEATLNNLNGLFVGIGILLAFPWINFFLLIKASILPQNLPRYLFTIAGIYLGILIIVFAIVSLAKEHWHIEEHSKSVAIPMAILLFAALIFTIIFSVRKIQKQTSMFRRDRKNLSTRGFIFPDRKGRAEISEEFFSFSFPQNRLEYVTRLEFFVHSPTGSWPGGSIPDCGDEASTRLLKLEQKWTKTKSLL